MRLLDGGDEHSLLPELPSTHYCIIGGGVHTDTITSAAPKVYSQKATERAKQKRAGGGGGQRKGQMDAYRAGSELKPDIFHEIFRTRQPRGFEL